MFLNLLLFFYTLPLFSLYFSLSLSRIFFNGIILEIEDRRVKEPWVTCVLIVPFLGLGLLNEPGCYSVYCTFWGLDVSQTYIFTLSLLLQHIFSSHLCICLLSVISSSHSSPSLPSLPTASSSSFSSTTSFSSSSSWSCSQWDIFSSSSLLTGVKVTAPRPASHRKLKSHRSREIPIKCSLKTRYVA